MRSPSALLILLATLGLLSPQTSRAAQSLYYGGSEDNPVQIPSLVGADWLWAYGYLGEGIVIANVEGGHVWLDHDVFQRFASDGSPIPTLLVHAPAGDTELGEHDYHATMVGHILAGGKNSDVDPDTYLLATLGMAPRATLWSGAIATSFDKTLDNLGAFDISDESFLYPYVAFFTGTNPVTNGARADVINGSWGFDDPTFQDRNARIITGLAAANPDVAAVFAAGNSGYGVDQVGGPAYSPNVISVGSLGGPDWLTPSTFSSGGPIGFYDPILDIVIPASRSAVHISAPGESLFLAAYLGYTGSLEPALIDQEIEETFTADLYFAFTPQGTSFSAPAVAGGIALLKDVANTHFPVAGNPGQLQAALDTRVIRSLIMATALRTEGWDNGQHVHTDGSILTTQAVDYRTGAGAFNVLRAAELYVIGTADVPGLRGGSDLAPFGWDFGALGLGEHNDYVIDLGAVTIPVELIVSLNWFVSDTFDLLSGETAYGSFADLDLEIWSVGFGDVFDTLLAASRTAYDTTEFLRFPVAPGARYGIRITFDRYVYDFDGTGALVGYGLAWVSNAIPEPSAFAMLTGGIVLAIVLPRRRRPLESGR